MAYTCPTITIPGYTVVCTYYSERTGRSYHSGDTLPAIYDDDGFNITIYYDDDDEYEYELISCGYKYYSSEWDKHLAGWNSLGFDPYYHSDEDAAKLKLVLPTNVNGKKLVQVGSYRADQTTWLDNGWETHLITAPSLPASLKDITAAFKNCSNLEGVVDIDCNPTYYSKLFEGTTKNIKLTGLSTMLDTLASGYSNVTVYHKTNLKLLAQRCDQMGNLTDEGTSAKLTCSVSGDPIGVIYTAKIYINGIEHQTKTFTVSSTDSQNIIWYINDYHFLIDTSYAISLSIDSSFDNQLIETVSSQDTLTTAFFTMDFGNEGHQIAFGRSANADPSEVPDNGRFDCAMDVNFEAGLKKDGIDIPTSIFKSSKTSSELTVNANGYLTSETITITRTDGAVPVGIVGYFVDGTNRTLMNLNRLNLSTAEANRAVVTFDIRNTSSTKVTNCTVKVDVLWVK